MKILVATHRFFPDVGGLETVARVLAEEFTAIGHEVILLTDSTTRDVSQDQQFPFVVVRQPGIRKMISLLRWSDVYFQNNISLRTLWPALAIRKRPWVVSHQTWLTRVNGAVGWQDRLKMSIIRYGSPIAISQAVAKQIPVKATIIGNPYQANLFRQTPGVPRTRDIVFLARLVSDKGGDLTLEALAKLRASGLTPNVTVVGDGPEMGNLQRMARELGVHEQVTFAGIQTGETLVRTLNEHRIMAVPSRLAEPFGVVALEGIACGCVPVGSHGGGLVDAIGSCGVVFPNGDADEMAACLRRLLTDEELCGRLRAQAPEHLERHHPRRIAEAYLRVFEEAKGRCS